MLYIERIVTVRSFSNFPTFMVMSHPSEDSSKRGPDVRNSSSSSSGVGDEKSREGRPQEDDTLSSILLMLKSNTNDDDDDVATDDLEVQSSIEHFANNQVRPPKTNVNISKLLLVSHLLNIGDSLLHHIQTDAR